MEINFNKSITAEPLNKSVIDLTEENPIMEKFSLILDAAVSQTREKTSAADNLPNKENKNPLPEKKNLPPDAAQNFAALFGVKQINPAPLNNKTKNISEISAEPEISEETESQPENTMVSGGLIQTEMQQAMDKINSALRVDTLSATSAKPKPLPAEVPVLNFEEIYAQARQAMRMIKDGQVLKLKFAIEPENLGKLDVYVFADKKDLHISFASGAETRKLLEAASADLQDILAQYGFGASNLDFSGYSGGRHQELESQFLAQGAEKNDFGILKIINKKDIINEVCYLLRDVLVNYMA